MTSENRRVLIVEAEYLVAMEAERILIELFACAVEIVTQKAFPSLLRQNGRYDLVILDLGRAEMPPDEALQLIHEAKAPVIFSTLLEEYVLMPPGTSNMRVVRKPFDEEELAVTVRAVSGWKPVRNTR